MPLQAFACDNLLRNLQRVAFTFFTVLARLAVLSVLFAARPSVESELTPPLSVSASFCFAAARFVRAESIVVLFGNT